MEKTILNLQRNKKLKVLLGFAQSAALTTWPELKNKLLHCAEPLHQGQRADKHIHRHHLPIDQNTQDIEGFLKF